MINKNSTKQYAKCNPPFYFIEGKGWFIDTKIKTDAGFKHMRKGYFHTLASARSAYQGVIDDFRAKHAAKKDRRECTFLDFCKTFAEFRRTQIKGSSLMVDKCHYREFISLFGEDTPVTDCFSRKSASKLQTHIMHKGIARKSKNKIIALYRAMAEFAYDREYIDDDRPVRSETYRIAVTDDEVTVPREKRVIDIEEEEKLLQVIADPRDKMLVYTLFSTGLRIGEALALTPSDFNPLECELEVTKTVSVDEDSTRKVYNRTKTALGVRKVPVSAEFMNVLASYVSTLRIAPKGLLFPPSCTSAHVMDASAFRKRLSGYCASAGIKEFTPHSIRHTYATRLSYKCHTDAERQARAYVMGHSVSVDEQVYTAHNQLETAKLLIK